MKNSSSNKILFFADYYLPGVNAGGPIKSLANLFDLIADDLEVTLITRDHDFKSTQAYTTEEMNKVKQGKIKIVYVPTGFTGLRQIFSIIKQEKIQKIFLNSLFSVPFSIFPLLLYWIGLISVQKIYLAPRGELASSALAYGRIKKKFYLFFLKISGLIKKIQWVANSETELKIVREFTGRQDVVLIPNIGMKPLANISSIPSPVDSNKLKLIFYSRISPIKNLKFIYETLKDFKQEIILDIFGPITDQDYWNLCEITRETLPSNIKVNYHSTIDLEQFKKVVQNYHWMYLPTEGENFGQAIYECLACGRPVLISDQTPWRNLSSDKAGHDLPLSKEQFIKALDQLLNLKQSEMDEFFRGSLARAQRYYDHYVQKERIIQELKN